MVSIAMAPLFRSIVRRSLRAPFQLIPDELPLWVVAGPMRGRRWMAHVLGMRPLIGRYEARNVGRLLALLAPGAMFYDIGANAGFFTLLGAQAVGPTGRVIAIEPNPINLRRLRDHVELNRFADRVTVVPGAAADRSGVVQMDFDSTESGHLAAHDTLGSVPIEAFTIDDLVFDRGMAPPSVCKIDVEGAELSVLRGANRVLAKYRPAILLELHTPEMDRECPAFLRALGYEIIPHGPVWASDPSIPSEGFVARFNGKTTT